MGDAWVAGRVFEGTKPPRGGEAIGEHIVVGARDRASSESKPRTSSETAAGLAARAGVGAAAMTRARCGWDGPRLSPTHHVAQTGPPPRAIFRLFGIPHIFLATSSTLEPKQLIPVSLSALPSELRSSLCRIHSSLLLTNKDFSLLFTPPSLKLTTSLATKLGTVFEHSCYTSTAGSSRTATWPARCVLSVTRTLRLTWACRGLVRSVYHSAFVV